MDQEVNQEEETPYLFPLSELRTYFPDPIIAETDLRPLDPVHDESETYSSVVGDQVSQSPMYTTLKKNQFRLLRFQKRDDVELSGTLHFSMDTWDLSSPPPYYGLSYCWGDPFAGSIIDRTKPSKPRIIPTPVDRPSDSPALNRRIVCNYMDVPITENLHAALIELSKLEQFRVWVDQLCINQADLKERSNQILLMGRIYCGAMRTLAWTGPTDGRDRVTKKTLEYVLRIGRARAKFRELEEVSAAAQSLQSLGLPALEEVEEWATVSDILSRPWFTRAWVMQEVVLSHGNPILIYGDTALDLVRFSKDAMDFMEILMLGTLGTMVANLACELDIDVCGIVRDMRASQSNPQTRGPTQWHFHAILSRLTRKGATDARDRIYSLLGFTEWAQAPDDLPDFLVPNYTSDIEVLHQNCVRHAIERSGSLMILRLARKLGDTVSDLSCSKPTWSLMPIRWTLGASGRVLEYMAASSRRDDTGLFDVESLMDYHAAPGMPARSMSSEKPTELILRGIEVEKVHSIWYEIKQDDEMDEKAHLWILDIWESAMSQLELSSDASDEEHQAFAAELFLILSPVVFSPGQQSLRVLDSQCLKDIYADVCTLYEACPDRKLSPELLNRYQRFAEGGRVGALIWTWRYDRFFLTESGHLGRGPSHVRAGDIACVLFGGQHPMLLRECGEGFHLLGEVLVRGFMNGEAVEAVTRGELEERWFHIH